MRVSGITGRARFGCRPGSVPRFFEPVDNLRPTSIYRLKDRVFVGIFDTAAQVVSYTRDGPGLSTVGLTQQFSERNIVVDVTEKLSTPRSLALQNKTLSCIPL